MPLLREKMRRYVSCACFTSARDSCVSDACDDATCGPLARRRRKRMSHDDIVEWLDDLSTVAECDVSRSLLEKNNELDSDVKESELSVMKDLDRSMSELSLHVAINSLIFTTTTASSSSNRDVTDGNVTTSSGYEAGTCWSRDDDVITHSDDDDEVRVSWSESTGSSRLPAGRPYYLSPLRVAGNAVYIIDSERLALTSLPVMSPEVVRCVWDEHRRLRLRGRSPPQITAPSRVKASKNDPSTARNFTSPTTRREDGNRCRVPNSGDDLWAWYEPDCDELEEQSTPEKNDVVQTAFLGVELVEWLQRRVPRLAERSDAVQYAHQLLLDGLIYHIDVEDGHCHSSLSFNEYCLYCFTPEPCDMHRTNWRRCLRL